MLGSTVELLQSGDLDSTLPTFVGEFGPQLGLDDLMITRIEDDQPESLDQRRVRTRDGAQDRHDLGVAPGTELSFPLVRGEHLLGELQTTFLGSVSHDLRTTVTIIEGFAMLLSRQGHDLTEAQRTEFVDRIWLNARSLSTLIEDLLHLARLDKTTSTLSLQAIDLTDIVPQIVTHMSTMLANHAVSVRVAPHVVAYGDPVALEQIRARCDLQGLLRRPMTLPN